MGHGMWEEIVDGAHHAANETLEAGNEAKPVADFAACMSGEGHDYGAQLAEKDLGNQAIGTVPDHAQYEHAMQHAMDDCHYDSYVPHDAPSLPSLTNPVEAFIEVAGKPSELNAGESQYFAGRDAFQGGFGTGYHETVENRFDDMLGQRLDIDWGHDNHPVPPPVDHVQDYQFQNAFDTSTGFGAAQSSHPVDTHPVADTGASHGHDDSGSASHGDSGGAAVGGSTSGSD